MPHTILRATQFHDFVGGFYHAQRRLPRLLTLDVPFQPIDTGAVAARLVELVAAYRAGLHTRGAPGPGIRFADWARSSDEQ